MLDVSEGFTNVCRLGRCCLSRSMLSRDSFDSYRGAVVSTIFAVLLLTGVSTFRLEFTTPPASMLFDLCDKSLVLTDFNGLGVMFCSCCLICSCWSFMMFMGLAEVAEAGRLALASSFSDETGSTRFFQSSSPHRFSAANLENLRGIFV